MSNSDPLYVFIDEAGNFDFSLKGSLHYVFTAVMTYFPWECAEEIITLRYRILSEEILAPLSEDYLEEMLCHHFHACEDKQVVRNEFFGIIQRMGSFKAHSIIVKKNKTNPSLYDPGRFYPKMLGFLLDYILKSYTYTKLCIFVDGIPVNKKKKAFLGAIKSEIKSKNPGKPYKIYHPNSASSNFLQIADYINWAIYRKWEQGDTRSYEIIKHFLDGPEFDIFSKGRTIYY